MKVLVPIKRVIDYNVRIRVKSDYSGVEISNIKMSINPFDEIAIEESIRLHEAGKAEEIIVATIGPQECQETLRAALALGAQRAIHIETVIETQPLGVAKVLKSLVERENIRLVIMGKQAIDDDCNQTGQMLAALLGWPQGTFISQQEILGESVHVTREADGGLEFLKLQLPAVLTTDLRLNQPRYATLPNIMKAKQKPLEVIKLEELGVDMSPRHRTLRVDPPPIRQAGIKVETVQDLVNKLRNEAKVIP